MRTLWWIVKDFDWEKHHCIFRIEQESYKPADPVPVLHGAVRICFSQDQAAECVRALTEYERGL